MYAQIDTNNGGFINATTSTQVAGPFPQGIIQVQVPDNLGDVAGLYTYDGSQFVANPPPDPASPDLATQLAIALINNGTIDQSAIDAATLTSINQTLAAIGKPTLTGVKQVTP